MAAELRKILYIEDEPDIQTIAKLSLEQVGGFEVCICSSGAEGLEKIKTYHPDLILLDVMMPGMDGPTTLAELKKNPALKKIPMVFMTAKAQPQEIEQFKRLGVVDVITKPFDPVGLPTLVRKIWMSAVG
ncbi:MAG: response regulator [Gammaproteobacteria bacterium]|nr:response regulator [Gammaproteobacteria bacterium]